MGLYNPCRHKRKYKGKIVNYALEILFICAILKDIKPWMFLEFIRISRDIQAGRSTLQCGTVYLRYNISLCMVVFAFAYGW